MHLPPVQPISFSEIHICGDVVISDSAVVAPGVILQAAPNSRIIIGPGVCIGMGTILNAYQGAIEIESNAVLGTGVLIIGAVKVGKNACIGSLTTIFQTSVAHNAMITPGSLLESSVSSSVQPATVKNGISPKPDKAASILEDSVKSSQTSATVKNGISPKPDKAASILEDSVKSSQTSATVFEEISPPKPEKTSSFTKSRPLSAETPLSDETRSVADTDFMPRENENATTPDVEVTTKNSEKESQVESKQAPVVGQVYINQLLLTLFPERRS